MRRARLTVFFVGLLLPYAARLPGGVVWLTAYTNAGVGGWLLLNAFNAIAWGSILAISFLYRRPAYLLAPSLPGFGYLAWAHYTLDLAADAQASLGIIFIPIHALLPILVGGGVGYVLDRRLR
ncbi:hypothetical protein [Pseudomonas turukhanskensis]|uniref:Uncharacterized protein n=1 Tax=Pseudomonas turukhanskensis TaxID=1806536 RepID=A0A9W6NFY6_9PSED|nr:hypothetical protein [Pseudomonas turukhanskensis]GLK89290.1 hypothetical protein GCM10017655_23520 [Pseudomonas turukhanskensis]